MERLKVLPSPDLVLTVMMMPVMSGAELLASMLADPVLRDIPVVVLSSLPEAVVAETARGAAGFLRKSYTAQDVLDIVARLLSASV